MKINWVLQFKIKPKTFNNQHTRPTPPPGYIEYNSRKVGPSGGKCPNCGHEKPGIWGVGGGFIDRQIQNVSRAMDRLKHKGIGNSYELFIVDVSNDGEEPLYLRDHPSRYGNSKFMCCGAKIWHDFFDDENSKYSSYGWRYYYKPKICETVKDVQAGLNRFSK